MTRVKTGEVGGFAWLGVFTGRSFRSNVPAFLETSKTSSTLSRDKNVRRLIPQHFRRQHLTWLPPVRRMTSTLWRRGNQDNSTLTCDQADAD
jgi:hypothetical protein